MKSKCCGFTRKAVDVFFHCLNNIKEGGVNINVKGPYGATDIICIWTENVP